MEKKSVSISEVKKEATVGEENFEGFPSFTYLGAQMNSRNGSKYKREDTNWEPGILC
jgi:hypothetical protein